MDGINNAKSVLDPWWTYFDYCFNVEPFSPVCGPFWERIIVAVVVVGLIAAGYGAFKYRAYRRQEHLARLAEWEREQSDEVGIRDAEWNGDKAFQAELPDTELQQRIRDGLEQRRRETREATAKP